MKTLYDDIKKYIELRLELAGIEFQENLTEIISRVLILMVLLVIASTFLGFLSLSLAFYLGEVFNAQSLGFLAVALLYLLVGIVLVVLYRSRSGHVKARILTIIAKAINNKSNQNG